MCAFNVVPSSLWQSVGLRLLYISSDDIHRLWILGSSTIGDVTVLISHIQYVTVITSWSGVVHRISFLL